MSTTIVKFTLKNETMKNRHVNSFVIVEAAANDMQKLEEQATSIADEISSDKPPPAKGVLFVRGESQNTEVDEMGGSVPKNPEEIQLDDGDSDSDSSSEEEEEEADGDVPQQKKVPDEVSVILL